VFLIKKRIEERFDEIKSTTEKVKNPQLSDSERAWLTSITDDITKDLSTLPNPWQEKVRPILNVMKRNN